MVVAEPSLRARLDHVSMAFGTFHALTDIDLFIRSGEIVVVLGENGAGKTTMCRILATSLRPTQGEVQVNGVDALNDPHAARRNIGIVLTEERSFYWRITARQNLEFFGVTAGCNRKQALELAAVAMDRVKLIDKADVRVSHYSAGMRSRLLLARALLLDPPLLILDEATRSLDPVAAEYTQGLVRELAAEGRGVLYATHDLHEAASLAHRIIVLHRGHVVNELEPPFRADELGVMLATVLGERGSVT
jgi:ABC-2 type transport system ATP-binding protein